MPIANKKFRRIDNLCSMGWGEFVKSNYSG